VDRVIDTGFIVLIWVRLSNKSELSSLTEYKQPKLAVPCEPVMFSVSDLRDETDQLRWRGSIAQGARRWCRIFILNATW